MITVGLKTILYLYILSMDMIHSIHSIHYIHSIHSIHYIHSIQIIHVIHSFHSPLVSKEECLRLYNWY